jgi:hypothetical protein
VCPLPHHDDDDSKDEDRTKEAFLVGWSFPFFATIKEETRDWPHF